MLYGAQFSAMYVLSNVASKPETVRVSRRHEGSALPTSDLKLPHLITVTILPFLPSYPYSSLLTLTDRFLTA